MWGAYNILRIADGEWKTTFRACYGLPGSTVMPIGLTNAPADFHRAINDSLRPFPDNLCTAYIHDILIHTKTLEEHQLHVKTVMEALSKADPHPKPEPQNRSGILRGDHLR